MFTLKLYRRPGDHLTTQIQAAHHVVTREIAPHTLELRAFDGPEPSTYDTVYLGERLPDMTAITDDNHFGWGLLENWEGNTTQHFRPYNRG
jgi:hypothetical protein